jgi:hypothetical protein
MAKRERTEREDYTARFPPGTLGRMEKALKGRESKADFIREAVSQMLNRRETAAARRSVQSGAA